MTYMVSTSVRSYINDTDVYKKFLRPQDAATHYGILQEDITTYAYAAEAVYQLARITIINNKKLEEFMKHLYKVPNTGKYVQKKYVRIAEGSIMYSIGHHRFIELARDAGAVYKVGQKVLISLDIFDEYMEQFREEPVKIKNPLWKKNALEVKEDAII